MDFKSLLNIINEARTASEAFARTGNTIAKERAKANAGDNKAKDAARKRAERAKQIPRDKQSKDQLIKQVYIVKTRKGTIELIFKDSYNPEIHTKINEKEVTMSEASQALNDPKFSQTRASILIFGKRKEGGAKEEKAPTKAEVGGKQKESKEEAQAPQAKKPAPKKARKMSKEEMFGALSQMTPEQLLTVPSDIRQEFFKAKRTIVQNKNFDNVMDSYEELTVKFGINSNSTLPYNQQVLNAFMLLAKLKSGASDQELQTYGAISTNGLEFTKAAFNQAKKLLSQIGDECLQNLLSSVETNQQMVDSAGATDMQCGNFRFKISAGGEIALSTTAFDQSNKKFKGYLANSMYSALQRQIAQPGDEKTAELLQALDSEIGQFAEELIPEAAIKDILKDPKMVQKLQKTELKDAQGNSLGFVLDENGNLNPYASLDNYQKVFGTYSKKIFAGAKANQSSLINDVSTNLLKTVLRGDNLIPPEFAPNHVVTANGVFPLTDDYINEISKTVDFQIKTAKDLISSENIQKYKPAAAALLKNYRTIVEQNEEEPKENKASLKNLFVKKDQIDPLAEIVKDLIQKNDFNFNASLLPGFSPKDLNTVEYNYVRIGKKTVKIPVVNDETPTISQLMSENYVYINDMLVESMTNSFVLKNLEDIGLINSPEKIILENGVINLLESEESTELNLIKIFENVLERIIENPYLLNEFHEITYGDLSEKYVRDYDKEYRNYHGKAKQRKERAARTRARELMKKKGLVRKGDGVDIDHKKPLRSGGSNGINNLRRRKKSENRADNGHKKGEKQNKDWK
jgi:hypothetical protein